MSTGGVCGDCFRAMALGSTTNLWLSDNRSFMERVREGDEGVDGGREVRAIVGCDGDRFIGGRSGDEVCACNCD